MLFVFAERLFIEIGAVHPLVPPGGARIRRHNEVMAAIANAARDQGWHVQEEPSKLVATNRSRPDLLFSRAGERLATDVTVVFEGGARARRGEGWRWWRQIKAPADASGKISPELLAVAETTAVSQWEQILVEQRAAAERANAERLQLLALQKAEGAKAEAETVCLKRKRRRGEKRGKTMGRCKDASVLLRPRLRQACCQVPEQFTPRCKSAAQKKPEPIPERKLPALQERFRNKRYVLIDEASMMSKLLLSHFDERLRNLTGVIWSLAALR